MSIGHVRAILALLGAIMVLLGTFVYFSQSGISPEATPTAALAVLDPSPTAETMDEPRPPTLAAVMLTRTREPAETIDEPRPPKPTAVMLTRTPEPVEIPVQLAWFYKPPSDGNVSLLARRFNLFILTKTDEPTREALRAAGIKTPFLQYLRLDAVHDVGSCRAQPYRNQVADRPGDFCAILQSHPDWLLRDERGSVINQIWDGAKYAMMDPGNSGWREFWLDRARTSVEQLGWDGVFLDNVPASREKLEHLGLAPAAYPDDASFQSAVERFLAYLSTSYFGPSRRPLYANIIDLRDASVWFRYLAYLDGAMEEAFAVGWGNDYLTATEWEEQANRVEKTQALGKRAILISNGPRDDLAREEFAFASYLLVNQGRASFRYTNGDSYDEIWLYDNYLAALGQALGPRYRNGDSWQRDYSKGKVVVDPLAHQATISVHQTSPNR